MDRIIRAIYFSPTHSSRKITQAIAAEMAEKLGYAKAETDLTPPEARRQTIAFGPEDLLVLGFPVYGGRIPEPIEEPLSRVSGQGTPAVIAAVYGNRDYDDALLEAKDILTSRGFQVAAAGAFIAEHTFTSKVGTNRPDGRDMEQAAAFARRAAEKVAAGTLEGVTVKGQTPYKSRGPSAPVTPKTSDGCTGCMACVKACPMGAVSKADPHEVGPNCIRCFACVKSCPAGAKYFDSEMVQKVKAMLEGNFTARREPELFL